MRASTSTPKSRCRGASLSAATSGPCAAVRIARGVRARHFLRRGFADFPRSPNTLSRIFHDHFDSFAQSYDCLCAKDFGRFHLEWISCVLPCQCRKSAGTRTRTPALGSHLRGRHLLARVYEIDIWACPVYCGRISVIAVILDPAKIHIPQLDEEVGITRFEGKPVLIDSIGKHRSCYNSTSTSAIRRNRLTSGSNRWVPATTARGGMAAANEFPAA